MNQFYFSYLFEISSIYQQKVLLWSQNTSRSSDTDPTDEVGGRKTVVFDHIGSNHCACSAKSGLEIVQV